MGVRLRDDVIASFRLVGRSEWWVAVDLLAGLAGYVVWVAGSAALGTQLASLADYPVAPAGSPTMAVLAVAALLWLVLPAAVGVARVRSRLLNIRGNVEQDYRLDRPAALLVPPLVPCLLLLAATIAMGTVEPVLLVGLVPATLYLLVRTLAYCYRVYAFSRPSVLYAGLFATLAVQAGVLLLYLGVTTENEAIVDGAVATLGLPVDPFATISLGSLAVPIGLGATVAVPLGVVVAYLLVQTVAAAVVHVRSPTIRPSRIRTGQRYPPGLDVAATTTAPPGVSTASDSQSSSGSDAGGTAATGQAADDTAPPTANDGVTAAASPSVGGDRDDEAAGGGDVTDEAESVSHTRVFTPPGGGGDDPLAADPLDDGAVCPDCGATVPAGDSTCPACGAETS